MRNQKGLDQAEIDRVNMMWEFVSPTSTTRHETLESSILSGFEVSLDLSNATVSGSKTVYSETTNTIRVGSDILPGVGPVGCANSLMSALACLCHELSHAHRFHMGFRRPIEGIDVNLDEAETSIHASYMPFLSPGERNHLVEDAQQRLDVWINGGTR
ncbi:hypothetical protein [Vibrio parahaemolyticus]|uniref:hypothetical protein n=2 Tax=Vibrio parahaemolyticus TaxID=670 RepID=UPI001122FA04|nr:hypothetical protein [Vibrio parahaemolyticus]EHK4786527.1 hypothetical protein [Vibrio parahaemolyticus]EIJ0976103.1 hypothetical protein [Vibrio parahaemolyticus]MBM4992008.1 hypothetical protein [Vibrio parahaemolyticus]MBM4995971.1 hypothetical protein [Vibrio parahaemolyticus]MCG6485255.1 hypothetical protein [Vibrio parahaemolyticus]